MVKPSLAHLALVAIIGALSEAQAEGTCPELYEQNKETLALLFPTILNPALKGNNFHTCVAAESSSTESMTPVPDNKYGCHQYALAASSCHRAMTMDLNLAFYIGSEYENKLPKDLLDCTNENAKDCKSDDQSCRQTAAAMNCQRFAALTPGGGISSDPKLNATHCGTCMSSLNVAANTIDRLDRSLMDKANGGCLESCYPTAGDGITGGDEECDDGNLVSGDGCDSTMHVETGSQCEGSPSDCSLICGDGIHKASSPGCDDGNNKNGDGCNEKCEIEHGWNCTSNPAKNYISECYTRCGDQIIAGEEECDFGAGGNADARSGCTPECKIQPGFHWDNTTTSTPFLRAICGDGVTVTTNGETCDIGNSTSVGCLECQLQRGYTCDNTTCTPICGDGLLVEGEECDDGNQDNSDGCSSECKLEEATDANLAWRCDQPGTPCQQSCNRAIVRQSWKDMSQDERETFMRALARVQSTGVYAHLVGVHYESANDRTAHQTCAFWTWHALYLVIYGNALRASLGAESACIGVPYWDYVTDIAAQQSGECGQGMTSCALATRDFGGSTGSPTSVRVPGSGSVQGNAVAGNIVCDNQNGIRHSAGTGGSYGYCVRGNWDSTSIAGACSAGNFARVIGARDYASGMEACQSGCHNSQHVSMAGVMISLASPMDPIFFMHHGMIQVVHQAMILCQAGGNPSMTQRHGMYSNCGEARADAVIRMDAWEASQGTHVQVWGHSVLGQYARNIPRTYGAYASSTDLGVGSHFYRMSFMHSTLLASGAVSCANPSVFLEDDAAVQHHDVVKHAMNNDEDIVDHILTATDLLIEEEQKLGRTLESHESRSLLVENYDKRHNIPQHYAKHIHRYKEPSRYIAWFNRTSSGIRKAIRHNRRTSGMKYDDECRYVAEQVELIECMYREEHYGKLEYPEYFIQEFKPAVKKERCRLVVDQYYKGETECVYKEWRSTCDHYMKPSPDRSRMYEPDNY